MCSWIANARSWLIFQILGAWGGGDFFCYKFFWCLIVYGSVACDWWVSFSMSCKLVTRMQICSLNCTFVNMQFIDTLLIHFPQYLNGLELQCP